MAAGRILSRCLAMMIGLFVNIAVAAAADDPPAYFLDLDTGGHRGMVKDLAFTPDGEYLISASDDKTIRIWDWKAGFRYWNEKANQPEPGMREALFGSAATLHRNGQTRRR